jgi:hypothetical protein
MLNIGEKMILSMHYNIEVDEERKIATAKIYGIWKPETAQEYHKEYMSTVKPLLNDKWAKLTNLTNWKSSYPEIIDIIGDHMRWCVENKAEYSVYVIENPTTRSQLKRMIKSGDAEQHTKLFKTLKEAEDFLRDVGY